MKKKNITIYFYDISYEVNNINEFLADVIRSEYDLPLKTNIDSSMFEIDEENCKLYPIPVYFENCPYDITEEDFQKLAKEKILEEYGFNIPRDEYWYEIEDADEMTTNVIDKEIIEGLNGFCKTCDNQIGERCGDCFIQLAQERLEKYSNYLDGLLTGDEYNKDELTWITNRR